MRRRRIVCRKHGISEATFYNWKSKFGGMDVSEAKRLKALEAENAKLKRLLADAMLDNAALEGSAGKKMVTPAVKREAVAHLRGAHEMSERRACKVIGCDRMTVRYRSRRPDDPRLRERLLALARERRRFGYRRLLIFLRREGFVVNHKRLFRIYREERLMVRKRGGRKRALGTRTPMPGAIAAERPLVAGLRLRSAGQRAAVSYSGDLRRLHPGVPGGGRRCLAFRPPGGARTRSADCRPWQAAGRSSATTARN